MKARLLHYLITLVLVALAAWAAVSLYQQYIQNPWTRDCQVRANVVGIAPRVSGPIVQVAVHDNQEVQKGDLLFEIDPTDFQAQVDVADGQVQNDEATLKQQQQNLDRQTNLYKNHVTAQQDFQNAQDSFAAAQAQLISAKANLELAKLNLAYTKVFAGASMFRMARAAIRRACCHRLIRPWIGFASRSVSRSASRFWENHRCHCGLAKPFRPP